MGNWDRVHKFWFHNDFKFGRQFHAIQIVYQKFVRYCWRWAIHTDNKMVNFWWMRFHAEFADWRVAVWRHKDYWFIVSYCCGRWSKQPKGNLSFRSHKKISPEVLVIESQCSLLIWQTWRKSCSPLWIFPISRESPSISHDLNAVISLFLLLLSYLCFMGLTECSSLHIIKTT